MNPFADKVINTLGKVYFPALLPSEIERGKLGDCFDHCLIQALYNPQYQYVEGLVYSPLRKEWIYHAWLTDGIYAYDPTWHAKDITGKELPLSMMKYIGVEMDVKKVAEFVRSTEYKAVFENYWRNERLAEEIFL